MFFNEIERIYKHEQLDNLKYLYGLYDDLWLHSNAEVTIMDSSGCRPRAAKVVGIDEYGYLLLQ